MESPTIKNPIQTYALIVCYTSLLISAIFFGIAAFDVVQMIFPNLTNPFANMVTKDSDTVVSGSVRMMSTSMYHTNEQHVAMARQSFLSSAIAICIGIAVFTVHWRLAKKHE